MLGEALMLEAFTTGEDGLLSTGVMVDKDRKIHISRDVSRHAKSGERRWGARCANLAPISSKNWFGHR